MHTEHTEHTPAYIREHYALDTLPIVGDSPDDRTYVRVKGGKVRRVKRYEYVLYADGITSRARWGTAEQIAEDIAYLETFGTLPPASKHAGF